MPNEWVNPAWSDQTCLWKAGLGLPPRYTIYLVAEKRRMPVTSHTLIHEAGSEDTGVACFLLMGLSNASYWCKRPRASPVLYSVPLEWKRDAIPATAVGYKLSPSSSSALFTPILHKNKSSKEAAEGAWADEVGFRSRRREAGKWERKDLEGDFPRIPHEGLSWGMKREREKESHVWRGFTLFRALCYPFSFHYDV